MPSMLSSLCSRFACAAVAVAVLAAAPVFGNAWGVQLASSGTAKAKRIVTVNGPLAEVIAHLGQHFNGEIILADADMGSKVVMGAYDMDNPALTLQTIVSSVGGQVTEVTPWMLIVSAQ